MTSRRTQEEIILFEKIGKNEAAALAALYDRYQQSLYGQIVYFELERDQAENAFEGIFNYLWDNQESIDLISISPYRYCLNLLRLICFNPDLNHSDLKELLNAYQGLEMKLPGDVFAFQEEIEKSTKTLDKVEPKVSALMKSIAFTCQGLEEIKSSIGATDIKDIIHRFTNGLKAFKEDFKAEEFLDSDGAIDLVLLSLGRIKETSNILPRDQLENISQSENYQSFQKALVNYFACAPLEMPRKVVKKKLLERVSPPKPEKKDDNEPIVVKVPISAEEMAAKKQRNEPTIEHRTPSTKVNSSQSNRHNQSPPIQSTQTTSQAPDIPSETQPQNQTTEERPATMTTDSANSSESPSNDLFAKYKVHILVALVLFALLFGFFLMKTIVAQNDLKIEKIKNGLYVMDLKKELEPNRFIAQEGTEVLVLGNRLAQKSINGVFFYNKQKNQAYFQLNQMTHKKKDIFYQLWLKEENQASFKSLLIVDGTESFKNHISKIDIVLKKQEGGIKELQLRRLNKNGSDEPQGRIVLRYQKSG